MALPAPRDDDHAPLESDLRVRTKVWVERADGEVVISDFRARLLEEIERRGSVAAAARDLDLPYRTAWKKLQEMEHAAGASLLETASGGAEGGTTHLTPTATELLRAFRELSRAPHEAASDLSLSLEPDRSGEA